MSDAGVRTARVTDADAVADVQTAVWRSAYGDVLQRQILDALHAADFAQAWRQSLLDPPSPRHRLLVATEGETVVGYAALEPVDDATAVLADLGVTPSARGRGHGSRLLNATVDTLAANDFTLLEAWPLSTAEQLQNFLRGAGFGSDGAWRDRIVSSDDDTVREVRLLTDIGAQAASMDPDEHHDH